MLTHLKIPVKLIKRISETKILAMNLRTNQIFEIDQNLLKIKGDSKRKFYYSSEWDHFLQEEADWNNLLHFEKWKKKTV